MTRGSCPELSQMGIAPEYGGVQLLTKRPLYAGVQEFLYSVDTGCLKTLSYIPMLFNWAAGRRSEAVTAISSVIPGKHRTIILTSGVS